MNPRRAAPAALVGLVLTAGAAQCSRPHVEAVVDAGGAPATILLATPPTTDPRIALSNLDAEIADREKRARAGEADAPVELVGRYLTRAKYVGRVADLVAADAMSADLVRTRDGDAKAHLARAGALAAIHQFTAALSELDRAAALKAPADDVARERAAVLLAVGREDEAAALLGPADDAASVAALAMRGGVESRLGRSRESDRLFELARTRYHDVSPFTVASLDFERSRALELAGRRAQARAYLEEVATVLPCYAHAVVHLAALEPPDRAMTHLDGLARSDDPDVLAGRADALRRAGRAEEAATMADRARARFEEVLGRLPLAFADHAASFYLGMGRDAGHALALARVNARNRPTDEAIELWLSAAQAAGSREETCAAAAAAKARPHAAEELRERAATAARGCS